MLYTEIYFNFNLRYLPLKNRYTTSSYSISIYDNLIAKFSETDFFYLQISNFDMQYAIFNIEFNIAHTNILAQWCLDQAVQRVYKQVSLFSLLQNNFIEENDTLIATERETEFFKISYFKIMKLNIDLKSM